MIAGLIKLVTKTICLKGAVDLYDYISKSSKKRKRSYDGSVLSKQDKVFILKMYKEWKESGFQTLKDRACETQEQFAKFLNGTFGVNKSKSTYMRIIKNGG